jgi:predicted XRE-type DNA-binding protein
MSKKKFDSVWDALEDDPVKREIYKLRSELIHVITEHIKANNLKQREVAELLSISQPRVSTLMKRDFRVIPTGYTGRFCAEVRPHRKH